VTRDAKTLGGLIEECARRTGAPRSVVEMVRLLFSMKGVSLEADPEPYVADLEEFFPAGVRFYVEESFHRKEDRAGSPETFSPGSLQPLPLPGVLESRLERLRIRAARIMTPPPRRPFKARARVPGLGEVILVPGPEDLQ